MLTISLQKLKEASVAVRSKVHDVLAGNVWSKVMAILMHIWEVFQFSVNTVGVSFQSRYFHFCNHHY
jgi:hypothetical protein